MAGWREAECDEPSVAMEPPWTAATNPALTSLLNHLAETRRDEACAVAAQRIKDGYNHALAEGCKTRDLGGTLGTRQFADAVVARLS